MIKTTDAFKTVANGRTWEQLTYQEQQQIRLMSILEQSSAQFGNSIQQNTNYQLMQLTANLKNIALNLGNAFMPIVSVVLPCLNAMALALANVTAKLAAFMNALFGTNFNAGAGEVKQVATDLGKGGSGASGLADGMDSAADSADKAGKAAKKAGKTAKNALANFDEINSLAKDSGSGGGGGGAGGGAGGGTGVVESSAMSQAAESFADKVGKELERLKNLFKDGFEIGLGDRWKAQVEDIKKSIQGIKDSLRDIFTDNDVVNSFKNLVDSLVLNAGKIAGSFVSIGTTIAQNLLGGINKYLDQNEEYIKQRLIGIMDATSEIANLAGNFAVAFADVFSVFGSDTAQQITADIIAIFANSFLAVIELALKFGRDLLNCIVQPIIDNKDLIKTAIEETLIAIQEVTGTFSQWVTDSANHMLEVYDTYIGPAMDNIATGLSKLVNTALKMYNSYIVPMLQEWGKEFNELYTDHIKPTMFKIQDVIGKGINLISQLWKNVLEPLCEWLMSGFIPALSSGLDMIWNAAKGTISWIVDVIGDIASALEGVIDFLTGVFTGNWKQAWEGIKEMVSGIGQFVYDITIKPLTGIISWLASSFINSWKAAVEGIKNMWSPIGQWFNSTIIQPIQQFFTNLWNTLKQGASTAQQGVKSAWQSISSWFNSSIINPIKTGWSNAWNNIKSLANTCASGIKSPFSSLKSWMSSIVSSIKSMFSNLWSNIANGCKSAINGVLSKVESGINNMTSKVNSVTSKVGINIPSVKVPKLARGGIVDQATFMGNYIAGEAGKEMIVPLENTAFVDKLASSLGNAVMYAMSSALNTSSGIGGNGAQNVQLEMDGMILARTITPYIVKEMKRLSII